MPHLVHNLFPTGHSLVMYARWEDDKPHQAMLHLMSRSAGVTFSEQCHTVRNDLQETATELGCDHGQHCHTRIKGVAACSITNVLVRMLHTETVRHVSNNWPELMGFWEPPKGNFRDNSGLFMWFHPTDGYETRIVYNRNDAQTTLGELSWLNPKRQANLLRTVRAWNLPQHGEKTREKIDGPVARLLFDVAYTNKVVESRRRCSH